MKKKTSKRGKSTAKAKQNPERPNPSRAGRNPCPEASDPKRTKIYSRVIKIFASKAGMPHRCDPDCKRHEHCYVHEFTKKCCIWGLLDGRLLIE